ncbi:E3 SUMO-protein ligase PIAS4 [Rana temporaria]|uniref:E3 SUMO-protein ligase PIAS4 n=1 Tax=Rana temporaria TaxID=8407 RepID=UPI001AADED7E|nr:E3 SUMO-protein ligase PIAS4 [Rana temporaria]
MMLLRSKACRGRGLAHHGSDADWCVMKKPDHVDRRRAAPGSLESKMAAELVEAKNMVMSFRVSDLQMLLGYVGRSKSGLKHELVTRALQLVQFDCSPEVFKKIKELYETRYSKKPTDLVTTAATQLTQSHRSDSLLVHPSFDHGTTATRTQPNMEYQSVYAKHVNGISRIPPKAINKPEVRLVKLPFYDVVDELLKPTELVAQNSEKLQDSPCVFVLSPRQVDLIKNSRDLHPGTKSVQVVLRICYTDTSCPQEDQYPPNIAVKVNHNYCSVPGYYPSNKPGVEPKRPCRPINLTNLMYLSSASNRVTVTWGNYGKSYSVGLYLVRQRTSSELLQRLKTIGVKHPELCKTLVREKLCLDPDSEIATTGVRVSLICPLVKMRLTVPCRAETCAHLQCFDAVFYLQMNEKKPTWTCPVCDKPAQYDQIIIDGLLSKILSECKDADEIEFLVDGSWRPITAEKERSCSPVCPVLEIGSPEMTAKIPPPSSTVSTENGKPGPDVVDLTVDSSSSSSSSSEEEDEEDDDDRPSHKRRCYEKGLLSAC